MKSFIITLLLLAGMLLGIFANALYINNVANEMLSMLDSLPDVGSDLCAPEARKILDYWNQQSVFVDLSVSYLILDRITEQASLLVAAAECGDLYGFRASLALLRDAVGDMRRFDELSMGSIL